MGVNPNRVNVILLCRGDGQLDFCRGYVDSATIEIIRACPNYMQADLLEEKIMLRYSNDSIIFSRMDTDPGFVTWSKTNSTRPDQLVLNLRTLLDNVSTQASNGGSLRKVAYGSTPSIDFYTIYALEQCTPNLSPDDCFSCLSVAAQKLPRYGYGSIGVRVQQPSCSLQYYTYKFYNETRLLELQPVPMPPVPSIQAEPQPGPEPGNGDNSGSTTATRTIIIVVVSTVVGIFIVVLIGFLIRRINQKKPKEEDENDQGEDEISIIQSLQYDYSVIQAATNDFSEPNKLGQGGFGVVYKGKLRNGQEIAVKRLSRGSGQGDLEFKNEVMLLAKLQHRNLVSLTGFSLEGQEKLLIYEFVQNASLDQHLFNKARRSQLDWNRRRKIIGGIARGILYLHEDSRVSIIHRDLKAGNVLLDGNMEPKISDFGMARLFVPDETDHGSTSRIVGTYGYMAPEYISRGQFSIKSDVFSFGVLLLEIISGLKNNCSREGKTDDDLISTAWENWHRGTAANILDPLLRISLSIPGDILRCIHIGLLCVQESAAQRPTMAMIVIMLNSFDTALPVPSPPPSCGHDRGYKSESSILQEFNSREGCFNRLAKNSGDESGDSISQNEMSISEMVAR